MDQNTDQSNSANPKGNSLIVIYGVILFLTAFGLGVFSDRFLFSSLVGGQSKAKMLTSLSLPNKQTENAVVQQWSASVEGQLVEKSSNTITIERGGVKLVISIDPQTTQILSVPKEVPKDQSQGLRPDQKVNLEDLKMGTTIRGGVRLSQPDGKVFGTALFVD